MAKFKAGDKVKLARGTGTNFGVDAEMGAILFGVMTVEKTVPAPLTENPDHHAAYVCDLPFIFGERDLVHFSPPKALEW